MCAPADPSEMRDVVKSESDPATVLMFVVPPPSTAQEKVPPMAGQVGDVCRRSVQRDREC